MLRPLLAAVFIAACATPVLAADMPAFKPQTLMLTNVPEATGPAVSLFNGKDLDAWDAWLGYADPAETYKPDHGPSLGVGGKGDIFDVREIDGRPAIFISGKTWGSLVHKGDYSNYHLRLQYKWSGKRHAPRLNEPENNGLLYHSHGSRAPFGAPGAVRSNSKS